MSSLLGVIFVMLSSSLFLCAYHYLISCDYFALNRTHIFGNQRISAETITDVAQLYPGKNILSVNVAKVRKRLMANPWIFEAEVSRELPDTIQISIKEHKALAILDLGRKFLINRHGEIFKEWIPEDPIALPVVKGLLFSDINVKGKPRSKIFNAVMEVLHLGGGNESVLSNLMIQLIDVDREMGLTLFAPEYAAGRIGAIKIGFNNYQAKLDCLKNVVYYLQEKRFNDYFETIDLNNTDRIVLLPAKSALYPIVGVKRSSDL